MAKKKKKNEVEDQKYDNNTKTKVTAKIQTKRKKNKQKEIIEKAKKKLEERNWSGNEEIIPLDPLPPSQI